MPAPVPSKSVLITGCSTGIGQSTALWLARAFDSFLRTQLWSLLPASHAAVLGA